MQNYFKMSSVNFVQLPIGVYYAYVASDIKLPFGSSKDIELLPGIYKQASTA